MGMGIGHWDQPGDISSAQPIGLWLGMTLNRMNLDIHPPFKGAVTWCILTSGPTWRDCVHGVHEVGERVERESGEVDCWDVLGSFRVLSVEFRHKSLQAFNIFSQSPFIFFDAISYPAYEIFSFPRKTQLSRICSTLCSSTQSQTTGGWRVMLNSFCNGVCIVG